MASTNPFARIANRYADLPTNLRRPLVTRAIGSVIPFVDTAGCFIEAYTPTRVAVQLDNREAVQNHLGGLHAAALALLAETASGLVVALNVPPSSSPLLRTMDVSFEQFARDTVQAEATLSPEEADRIQSRPIGKMDVDVTLTAPDDETTLVTSALQWAWVPEDRLSQEE
jgi:acyl-coenzyme A thioesterase PaaI-like protein